MFFLNSEKYLKNTLCSLGCFTYSVFPWDLWSKSVLLKLQKKWASSQKQKPSQFCWTSIVCIAGELAGGGSMNVAVCVGDRWQLHCIVNPEGFKNRFIFSKFTAISLDRADFSYWLSCIWEGLLPTRLPNIVLIIIGIWGFSISQAYNDKDIFCVNS